MDLFTLILSMYLGLIVVGVFGLVAIRLSMYRDLRNLDRRQEEIRRLSDRI